MEYYSTTKTNEVLTLAMTWTPFEDVVLYIYLNLFFFKIELVLMPFMASLFIMAPDWEPFKCLSADEWINKLGCINSSAIKSTERRAYITTWVNSTII